MRWQEHRNRFLFTGNGRQLVQPAVDPFLDRSGPLKGKARTQMEGVRRSRNSSTPFPVRRGGSGEQHKPSPSEIDRCWGTYDDLRTI